MAVSEMDVRHVADLARLGLDPSGIGALVDELNGILHHMEVLQAVATSDASRDERELAMPLRADEGPPAPLARPREAFAPQARDGFFLVPRLATHEENEVEESP